MKQITTADFKKAVNFDPAWASKLTEQVEITDYCDMSESKITHLSPLLHFTGRNEEGDVADFRGCEFLKTAEGTFHGYVRFSYSGIEKIDPEKLVITQPNNDGNAADFTFCKNLKIAQGNFPGYVDFSYSGIEKIDPEKLIITQPNNSRYAANFYDCPNLKVAQGTFPGYVGFRYSAIEKIGKVEFGTLDIQDCPQLKSCPANYLNNYSIEMDDGLQTRLTHEKKARDLFRQHKQDPIPEI